MKVSPCKDCPDRTVEPNCHDNCEKYKAWLAQKHAEQAVNKKRKEDDRTDWLRGTRAYYRTRKGYDQ